MDVKRLARNYIKYPEYPLTGRHRLIFNWIPKNTNILLDGGCAFGYATRFYKKKCKIVYGIDANESFVNIAKERYSEINFLKCMLEKTSFKSDFFDVVVLSDVIEHVKDDLKSLNEMFRVLKPGGLLILTCPNRGLLSFMDCDNYAFFLRTKFPKFYRFIYKLKKGKYPEKINPGYEDKHRHYSLKDLSVLLNKSDFNYEITKVFRSGFFIDAVCTNLCFLIKFSIKSKYLSKLLHNLSEMDFWIPYGALSNSIVIKVKKLNKKQEFLS